MINWLSKKISILGAGRSGIAAAKLGSYAGAKVLLSDTKSNIHDININNVSVEWGGHSNKVLESDFIIKSPGIPNNINIIEKAKIKNIKIISEIEFAGSFTSLPIIAITGSNGKTTTVELLNNIFKNAGYNSILGGNVGTPFSENVLCEISKKYKDGVHLLELSSFQLEQTENLSLEIGCILNISEDHLDRYKNYEEYINTKLKITKLINNNGFIVYNNNDEILRKKISGTKNSIAFSYTDLYKTKINTDNIHLKGKHNHSNIAAILAISNIYNISENIIINTLENFKSLPHRLEFIKKINGISIYNDSKATNIRSMVAAIDSFRENIVVVVGGLDKGNSNFLSAMEKFEDKIKFISCYGESGEKIFNMIKTKFSCCYNKLFSKAVSEAILNSKKDDVLLLSPGCASYDQFGSYIERGNKFKQIIVGLT